MINPTLSILLAQQNQAEIAARAARAAHYSWPEGAAEVVIRRKRKKRARRLHLTRGLVRWS